MLFVQVRFHVGPFFPGYFVDKYGRKWSIIGNAFLFTFGALVRFDELKKLEL